MVHEPASWEKLDELKTLNKRTYQVRTPVRLRMKDAACLKMMYIKIAKCLPCFKLRPYSIHQYDTNMHVIASKVLFKSDQYTL